MLRIFASGEGGLRVSELTVDLGYLGAVRTAGGSNVDLTGTGGDDILQGNGAANTLDGKGGDDILIDGKGEDRLTGGAGADLFVFEADGRRDIITDFQVGVDTIDLSGMGRAYSLDAFKFQSTPDGIKIIFQGEELRIFSHNGQSLDRSDFQITDLMGLWHVDTGPVQQEAQTLIGTAAGDVLQGGTGNDLLRGEAVRASFDDPAGQVFRLYRATLDRDPDRGGHKQWTDALVDGSQGLLDVISGFVGSREFQRTYGDATNREFVTLLYNNVLDRDPDKAGMDNWLTHLREGTRSREEVVRGFAQSGEFIRSTSDALTAYLRGLGENDRLEGGAGADVLYGGVLSDTFVFAAFDGGNHTVVDLEAWDRIELQGFGYGGKGGALSHFQQVGDDVVFEDQGLTVTFLDVDLDAVTAQMLILL